MRAVSVTCQIAVLFINKLMKQQKYILLCTLIAIFSMLGVGYLKMIIINENWQSIIIKIISTSLCNEFSMFLLFLMYNK